MDLTIYMLCLIVIGFIRVGHTGHISEDQGIVDSGVTTVEGSYEDIPIGQNLGLKKEFGAYTLILEELGLKRC